MGHIMFWSSSLYRPRSLKYSFCIIKTRFLVSCTPHDANDGRDVLFTQRACSYSFSLPLCVIRGLSSLISSRHLTVVSSIVKTKCALMITAVKRGRCTCKWVGFLFLWRSMMEIKDKDSYKIRLQRALHIFPLCGFTTRSRSWGHRMQIWSWIVFFIGCLLFNCSSKCVRLRRLYMSWETCKHLIPFI